MKSQAAVLGFHHRVTGRHSWKGRETRGSLGEGCELTVVRAGRVEACRRHIGSLQRRPGPELGRRGGVHRQRGIGPDDPTLHTVEETGGNAGKKKKQKNKPHQSHLHKNTAWMVTVGELTTSELAPSSFRTHLQDRLHLALDVVLNVHTSVHPTLEIYLNVTATPSPSLCPHSSLSSARPAGNVARDLAATDPRLRHAVPGDGRPLPVRVRRRREGPAGVSGAPEFCAEFRQHLRNLDRKAFGV